METQNKNVTDKSLPQTVAQEVLSVNESLTQQKLETSKIELSKATYPSFYTYWIISISCVECYFPEVNILCL